MMMGIPLLLAIGEASPNNVSTFAPASPPAESIRYLFLLVLAVTGIIFLLVEAVLLYTVIRFRRRAAMTTEPPQVYGSTPIEIAWTAAPALVVFLLVLVIIRTEDEVRANPPQPQPGDNALFVTVIGHQWWWEYVYEHYNGEKLGVITANELHVPASDPGERGIKRSVYLTLKSADVCHSFWVPRLAGKTDLIPGRTNHMWFQTEETGLYLGQCAEFCGTQHGNMLLRVYVDPPDQFQKWLDNERRDQPPRETDPPEVRDGREAFLRESCINCHRIRGTRAKGTYAPDLTHLAGRDTLASGMIENNRAELRRWVVDPHKIKPGCLMPAFGLNDRQVDLIVDYLRTLK